jgi:hypothetical protein
MRQILERNARAEIRATARGDKPTYIADPKSMNASAIWHQPSLAVAIDLVFRCLFLSFEI